ncbi:unnamed protein product [Diabrotica balteata]|uniref:Uncharacterized protein n=1 Tax=Diabrotica balteata TaxID=107213 RepID=A0A9N9X8M3_DIABA|nr:unnamed protein product [Diabrotica balteata]
MKYDSLKSTPSQDMPLFKKHDIDPSSINVQINKVSSTSPEKPMNSTMQYGRQESLASELRDAPRELDEDPSSVSVKKFILKFIYFYSRVHITRATLNQLGDKFQVENGEGASRENYLSDHKIETFLIVPPKQL